ncbi:HAUS augmin-like complex subunit 8 [Oryzias melastigma]|uniref:HAUS augmin-like complex, subunit 8 n=1 Tax=Oryzias melastigma TaxID=30732 RepID=A0A3B3BP68_ORYME|nr:HAUS augmin-like complex subunit 8 [Oryzias melastigma]
MASRRKTVAPSSFKNTSSEGKGVKSGTTADTKANNSGNAKKTVKPSGTIVKSRYLQAAEKTSLSKSNSLTNESVAAPQRPSSPKPTAVKPKSGTPTRRSMAPQALAVSMMSNETEPSLLGKSVLQSTFSDGSCFRPDFDISVIKDKTVIENTEKSDINPEIAKRIVEMDTFLLAYLTAKMEHNNAKFKAEAEARILQEMEEEEKLREEMKEKKHRYLLAEKKRTLNELLDLQIDILEPVAEAAKQFTSDYKCFASAVDTTRHYLPVKNFHVDGEGRQFLDKAEACLKETESLLLECTQRDHVETSTSLESLRDMKTASRDISQQLSGAVAELQELSSLVCQHSVHVKQAQEEEQLGTSRTRELFCSKQ